MAVKLNSEDCVQFDLAKKRRKSVFRGGMRRAEEKTNVGGGESPGST